METKKKNRLFRSNQGRSPRQMRSSYIGLAISGLGLVLVMIWILLDKYVL